MDDVEAFARAHRRKRQVRLFLLGAVIAAPFVFLGWRCYSANEKIEAQREAYRKELALSDGERASLRTSIAEARQRLAAAREGWTRAVTREALAAVAPGEGPCPLRLVAPTAQAAASYIRYGSIDGNYFGNIFFRSYPAGEPLRPLDLDEELQQLDKIAAELEASTADRNDASRVRDLEDRSLFVVVERETKAFVTPGPAGAFTPGRLVGTAYVYSYAQQRITCAGALDVQNSESIEFDYSYMEDSVLDKHRREEEAAEATLHRDLAVRVRQALARDLRAVAPPGAPGGAPAAPAAPAAPDDDPPAPANPP